MNEFCLSDVDGVATKLTTDSTPSEITPRGAQCFLERGEYMDYSFGESTTTPKQRNKEGMLYVSFRYFRDELLPIVGAVVRQTPSILATIRRMHVYRFEKNHSFRTNGKRWPDA